jgi:ribosomal protein S6--L-glutamate ligase
VTLSTEERELATRAATELGLDMAGVDVVRTEDGPVVLEVNTAPGLVKTESVTGVDLVTSVLEALVMRANPDQDLPAPVPTISA